ncbi:MFS transporter [Corynebacterium poyangense]|uniref:MFS transporter n=1 Tax=Corynebacterium poyangense TaxID=2684405 RepID=A0A7H0SRT3_9CORY|nr:MFS transporter [Corynebacterium poyangense]QNQ91258.1 MFS transporter [Corynebacterium poyangense]
MPESKSLPLGIRRSDPAYRRAVLAMLAAGLATFNAVYATQAVLPTFVSELGVTPDQAALTVSATTGLLAVCIMPASILSERFGRGKVLIVSALLATCLALLLPLAPTFEVMVGLRAVQGAVVAGVPAVAMTWLSEELDPKDLGSAMGIYVAGTTVGGLSGRLIPSGLLEFMDWRWAMFFSSLIALGFALLAAVLLPAQRRFRPKAIHPHTEFLATVRHLRNPRLLALFASAFVGMGTFVSLYNYIGFRMMSQFGLSEGLVGLVFIMYLAGTWSSARVGRLVSRSTRGRLMVGAASLMGVSILLLIPANLITTLVAIFTFTAAFFAMHSVASGWVGIIATENRAEGSGMYLFCYYAGSSIIGWMSGYVFSSQEWLGLIVWLLLLASGLVAIATLSAIAEKSQRRQPRRSMT